ncbi:hypothetical protein BC833DRAFT_616325 [Globomyces pollinis-pini]|nr:hypothetical protein BC833DRAFT_616325 [Globomyces pollinis-pini]
MSLEQHTTIRRPDKQTIVVKLITHNDTIERVLQERIGIKLGRQVKSPQDKALGQLVSAEAENQEARQTNDTTPMNPALPGDLIPSQFANSVEPNEKYEIPVEEKNSTEAVWFKSKVVSRSHAEFWLKDGQIYLRDVGSSSGTFLNKLRLSPANKMSRPYPIRDGDIVQLGVDYQSRTEEIYKAVEMKVSIEMNASQAKRQQQIPMRFKAALFLLLMATNPYATQQPEDPKQDTSVDCCICISSIGPFQALFIAPCSHCFHYKCIQHVLRESIMFPCPVCRQIANLDASVSMESLVENPKDHKWPDMCRSHSSLEDVDMEASGHFENTSRPVFGMQLGEMNKNRMDEREIQNSTLPTQALLQPNFDLGGDIDLD